jgi:hypothetical protein
MLANLSPHHTYQTEVQMRLSCQKALLILLVATIGCHESTGPRTVSANYALQAISGRQLPTYLATTPGPNATIFWATLTLDQSGKAVMTERRVDTFTPEATYTTTFDYRISGFRIEIGSFQPCPINASCIANMTGIIIGSTVNLLINPGSDFPINYEYHVAPVVGFGPLVP